MTIRKALNGYTIPTAVVAVLVSLAGLGWMNACTRLSALEAKDAASDARLTAHEGMAEERIRQLDTLQTKVDQMHGIMQVLKDRSDREERGRLK
jgi:hypothetical protein